MKRPQEALVFHLEALECITKIGDHTNLGSVYHQIGNCYGDLGDVAKSVFAYKEALRSFLQLGYKQYISNTMGEMGKVVAEGEGFDADLDEFLSEEVLTAGLQDMRAEVELLIETDHRPIVDDVMMLSKLLGIVKLISFTANAGMLKDWAQAFGNEIVAPLLATEFEQDELQHESFRRFLDLIINVAYTVGHTTLSDDQYSEEHVFRLCVVCDLLDRSIHWSRPFEWLAALLRSCFPAEPTRTERRHCW